MMARTAFFLVGLAAAVCVAACGGGHSQTASSAAQTTTASASSPTSAAVPTTATRPRTTPKESKPAQRRQTSAAASPPDGLRAAAGYGSYTNCGNVCSGAVPASVRRPLHLPSGSGCPVSLASGPVTPSGAGSALVAHPFIGSPWSGARVTWTAAASYNGPILIRGRQLDGKSAVGFGEGHLPFDELQLPPADLKQWPTFTRVRTSGCFAYQVDGTNFSNVIVFKATTSP